MQKIIKILITLSNLPGWNNSPPTNAKSALRSNSDTFKDDHCRDITDDDKVALTWPTQVDPHEEIRHGKVGDEKPRDVHLGVGGDQHHDHHTIPHQRQEEDDPDAATQRPPVK